MSAPITQQLRRGLRRGLRLGLLWSIPALALAPLIALSVLDARAWQRFADSPDQVLLLSGGLWRYPVTAWQLRGAQWDARSRETGAGNLLHVRRAQVGNKIVLQVYPRGA